MDLRAYQKNIADKVISAIADGKSPLVQADTGAGKTPIEAYLAKHFDHVIVVAHRNILIEQISAKLAAFGLNHNTISTEHTKRLCIGRQLRECGKSLIERGNGKKLVASVQSIIARHRRNLLGVDAKQHWVILIDEAHHVMPDNTWGMLNEIFPNAIFAGFTATPIRGDGGSLSKNSGGFFDCLVQADGLDDGKSVSTLIDQGFLAGYKAYFPVVRDQWTEVSWPLRKKKAYKDVDGTISEIGQQRIYGAYVQDLVLPVHVAYKRYCSGMKTIVMLPAVRMAKVMAEEFRAMGIPSSNIDSYMSADEQKERISAFVSGEILVLFNVDMVGEGFDVPNTQAIIMAKGTLSFGAYRQWCGRVLRPADGKGLGVLVDLVGNSVVHGMPDSEVIWNLDNPPKKAVGHRYFTCICGRCYLVTLEHCPDCGYPNPLYSSRPDGGESMGYWKDLRKKLSVDLVEKIKNVNEERKARREEELLAEKRPVERSYFEFGILGEVAAKIEKDFIDSLISVGIEYIKIHHFLKDKETNNPSWYVDRGFVLGKVTKAKAKKEFEAWKNIN